MSFGGGGGGAGSISTDSDVVLSSPGDGEVLGYNGTSKKWTNTAVSAGAGAEMTVNKDAANGYAGLNGSAHLLLATAPAGTSFEVLYDGTNWTYAGATINARPSSRTDLRMVCVNPVDTTTPSFAITGDYLWLVD